MGVVDVQKGVGVPLLALGVHEALNDLVQSYIRFAGGGLLAAAACHSHEILGTLVHSYELYRNIEEAASIELGYKSHVLRVV